MRDPERIDRILEIVRKIWKKHPDLRLMQLLLNATGDGDHYHMEDSELIVLIGRCYEEDLD